MLQISEITYKIAVNVGIDAPNGNTYQNSSLIDAMDLIVCVGGLQVNQDMSGFAGYVFDDTTGTIDFTNIGGIYNTTLHILYNKLT
jgi:hypothetical protein